MFPYTKQQLENLCYKRLMELIDYAGGMYHLGIMLGKHVSIVERWVKSRRVSKAMAVTIEHHPELGLHFKAYYLRPDIYVNPRSGCVQQYVNKYGINYHEDDSRLFGI